MKKIRSMIATVAAIGAVKRRGIAGLESYGGTVDGEGTVRHKTGDRAGTETKFVLHGEVGAKRN